MEGYPLGHDGTDHHGFTHNSSRTLHHIIEALKQSGADRARWRCDASLTGQLLSDDFTAERREAIQPSTARFSATHSQNYTTQTADEAGDAMGWFKQQGSIV